MGILRKVEAGARVAEACRKAGISVRAFEEFLSAARQRYFMINGRYFSQEFSFDLRDTRILDSIKGNSASWRSATGR